MVVLKFLKKFNIFWLFILFRYEILFLIYGNDKSYRFSKILDERFRYIYLIVEILWNFEKYMGFYYYIGFI